MLSEALTLRENDFANQPTSEFKALVVDEIDEESLVHGEQLGRATKPAPVRLVKITAENMSQMAILSWRWDGDLHSSRNIASAVHLAKAMSIKYLFIDQISIDQTLDGDALIERVLAFSTMYKTITVIAAYDKADEDFEKTTREPVNTRDFAYYDILLDGIKVAKLERHRIWLVEDVQYRFTVVLDGEEVILKALGVTDSEFLKEYALQEEARRSCLMLPGEETVPLPPVRIASVTL
ncbi:hypothetical protein BDV39DRAFT_211592 [Aspergillus sergii]|uniref:Heterokaryon incompatibility domain-containing protein n=1 Tax=Aspergillus sergii TaxID=1034303 RepID=A0A5N6WIM6_9EURO|nr:hypothetical protein BDV39DRAFT_211592 [Aspergillus sergii]